ncbi:MAG: hypothetical protein ACSW8D_03225, partial [Prevotella sp.]
EVRNLLHNPDALFRRVRDNRGLLHLSRNAKAYHPGQGVYRSAYMNARRMAATEINMAYRTADHLRVQQMDFVVGIEVHLSGNHNCKGVPPGQFVDICDELQGRYPKDFKFTGWHPFCRCYATTVLKTRQEMKEDAARIRNGEKPSEGSVNSVDTFPEGFTKWVDRNQQRIATARTLPYFLRDNGQINANGAWEPFRLSPDKTAQSSYNHEETKAKRAKTLEWGKKNIIGKLTYTNPAFGGKTATFVKNSFTENTRCGGSLMEVKSEILMDIENYLNDNLQFIFETSNHGTGNGFYKATTSYKGKIQEFKGRGVELQFKLYPDGKLIFHFIKII